jgi:pimeloyl-ACP methyl ester carboxylesterase
MIEIHVGPYRAEAYSPENARYTSRILLLHGLWAGAWCWRFFASFLAHRGWEVIAPDLRGRPGSLAADLRRVDFEDYAADARELISLATDPSPPVLVGHDLGGLIAIASAAGTRCRAVVALAPPLPSAHTDAYRELLRRSLGWFSPGVARAPTDAAEAGFDASRLQSDSGSVVRALLRGEIRLEPVKSPTLVVAASRDPFLDSRRLEAQARSLGSSFAERASGHWALEGEGFERDVDLVHRWLVQQLGSGLLKLTGYEDRDEEGDEGTS